MSSGPLRRTVWRGEPAWRLGSSAAGAKGDLELVVLPRRGAKIASLRHRGREWLHQSTRPLRTPDDPGHEVPFVEAEMAGWDECAPTIEECTVGGIGRLRDHGDLWDAEWQAGGTTGPSGPALQTVARGQDLRYDIVRWVTVHGSEVVVDYAVTSREAVPVPFLWAAHPQLAAVPRTPSRSGSRVYPLLAAEPDGDDHPPAVTDVLARPPARLLWHPTVTEVVLGRCRKMWSDPLPGLAGARLVHPDGASLTMTWSGAVSCVGVWADGAVYADAPVLALEPATGWYDATDRALAAEAVLVLDPGRTATWQLRLVLCEGPGKAVR